jgi:hypothetical protein
MKFTSTNNKIIFQHGKDLAKKEREITLNLLHHLREVERRSLFIELGYSSFLEFCVSELKYSVESAKRRISAMRLLKELPEIEEKD